MKAINNKITGSITLNDYSVALNGSSADVAAALAGSFASDYTGNVTITDENGTNISAADLSTIAGDTTGTIVAQGQLTIVGLPDEFF